MTEIGIVHIGLGAIGRQTIENLQQIRPNWAGDHQISLVFRGLLDTTGGIACDEPTGYSDETLAAIVAGKSEGRSLEDLAGEVGATIRTQSEAIEIALGTGLCVIVDCATGPDTAELLACSLKQGSGVALSNKAPLALTEKDQFSSILWRHSQNGELRYEATVGAGIPVIATLQGLLEAGDKVIEIQGTFSGTLGTIFSAVDAGQLFSDAVRDAKSRGFTEPDPRDDLSGLDVARKALIVARTIGMEVDLSDIGVESFVPAHLDSVEIEDFLQGIGGVDSEIADRAQQARGHASRLKYVARIVPGKPVTVGLEAIPESTVLGGTSGRKNVITIRTKRYDQHPLSLSGPGAGADVTAAGVVTDILAAVRSIGGP